MPKCREKARQSARSVLLPRLGSPLNYFFSFHQGVKINSWLRLGLKENKQSEKNTSSKQKESREIQGIY